MTLDDALAASPIMAILRGVRPDEILEHATALYDAGVRAVEVPLNSPEPLASISRLAEAYGDTMAVGAGTVLTTASVQQVAEAGGRLIVSPNTDPAVIGKAVALGLEPAPGFATASEAFAALAAGARHLKLFPAVTYGPVHLAQLRAVLPPGTIVWTVGGVGPDSMPQWRAAGADGFGVGGEIFRAGQTPAETRDKAIRLVAASRKLATR